MSSSPVLVEFLSLVDQRLPLDVSIERNDQEGPKRFELVSTWKSAMPQGERELLHLELVALENGFRKVVTIVSGEPDGDWCWPACPIVLHFVEGDVELQLL